MEITQSKLTKLEWESIEIPVSEEEKEINLLLVVGEMFLPHLLEGRREQVVVPAAAAAVAAEKEDVLNVVVVVVISSLSLNSNEYNKYNIKREMR